MDVALFMTLLTLGSVVSSLLTQAIKKAYENAHLTYSANMIALLDATIVGGGGTIVTFIFKHAPVNLTNVTFVIVMIVATWISCTIGYDKVIQTIGQLTANAPMDDKG